VTGTANLAPFYAGWDLVNRELKDAVRPLTQEQLAIQIQRDWPIWASVSHLAGTRVYWLCQIFKEPGAETTPFNDPTGFGWEDDLAHPRSADELVGALESTWRIVEKTLETWTPDSLARTARRVRGDAVQVHTRQSVLWRMITHDSFHIGEISLALGANGITGGPNGPIDIWRGLSRPE